LSASFGAGPWIVVAAVRHQNPPQALDREPMSQPADEREPLVRRSLMDQRLRGLMQNLVVHA